jgi:hypothetical protein
MSIRCGIPASIIPSQSAPAPRTIVFTMCAILLVPPIVSACGPALSASQGTSYEQRMLAPVGRQAPSDRVDRAELAAANEVNFDEALRRLRPEWMRSAPTTRQAAEPGVASVYVNDAYAGGLDALRLIPIDAVTNARYLTPTAARSWFGMFCPCTGGAILVSTRHEHDQ